mgnify:CR=1 FL=1
MKTINYFLTITVFSILLSHSQVDLNIADNGKLFITPTSYVYVSNSGNAQTLGTGELVINSISNAYGQLYVDGTTSNGSNFEYRLSASTTTGFNTAPVGGETAGDVSTNNANLSVLSPFDNNTATYITPGAGDVLSPGIGFALSTTDGGTVTFTGTLQVNDIPVTVKAGPLSIVNDQRRFNLFGNPFTTYLNGTSIAQQLGSAGVDPIYGAIYGWGGSGTTTGSGWIAISSTGLGGGVYSAPPGGTALITPGQGFAVIADPALDGASASSNIILERSERTVDFTGGGAGNGDDFIAGRPGTNAVSTWDRFDIIMFENNNPNTPTYSELWFIDEPGVNIDRGLNPTWDVVSLATAPFIARTVLADDSVYPQAMQKQVMPLDDLLSNNDWEIPLHVVAQAGQDYSITLDHGFGNTNGDIYLEDRLLNTFTLINDGTIYSFVSNSNLNGTGRFYLSKNNSSLGLNDNAFSDIKIYANNNIDSIVIEGNIPNNSNASLVDMQGRVIFQNVKLDSSTQTNTINVVTLSTGVYVISVESKNVGDKITKKLIIE